jgi:hypothetical protein
MAKGYIKSWISVPVVDRSGELLCGDVVELANHKLNPVVFFGHDRNRPLGIAQDEDGNYGVAQKQWTNGMLGLYGVTKFNLKNAFAAEVFEQYESGFLRGWSMGFVGRPPVELPEKVCKQLGVKAARYFRQVAMHEYSAVPIPDNQLALTDAKFKALKVPEYLMPTITANTPRQKTFPVQLHSSKA